MRLLTLCYFFLIFVDFLGLSEKLSKVRKVRKVSSTFKVKIPINAWVEFHFFHVDSPILFNPIFFTKLSHIFTLKSGHSDYAQNNNQDKIPRREGHSFLKEPNKTPRV